MIYEAPQTPVDEYKPVVLLPELQDPNIQYVKDHYTDEQLGVHMRYEQDMPLEEAARLLVEGEVDIVMAGIAHDTRSVLDVILKHFRKPDTLMSSYFYMEKEGEEPMFFADCAVVPNPTPHDMVRIAEHTVESARHLGFEPRVAFLSLETFDDHNADKIPGVVQVREAARRFKEEHPDIISYGPIQVDAARNPDIFRKKAEGKGVELVDGKLPNIFIFPDGMNGNISYKWKQETHLAVGPQITGVTHPFNDMSRGAIPEAVVRGIELSRDEFLARRHADALHERPTP